MNHGLKETLVAIKSMWMTKLITIGGVKLSLGNLLVALILLLFAARLSRLMVKFIHNRLIVRFVPDKNSQTTYQTFAFYGCLILVVVLSLTVAGIPLTVFSVVGGALAIGVGFGSQNIVNNFISGIILLIEQPIRIGDIVEIEGIVGTVVAINTRSTKIKNLDQKIFIIPNSFFLEKSVLNSTFSTTVLRITIDFGVAYGSNTRLVESICTDIMLNTEGVEQEPFPLVQFMDFAESNLMFRLVFFVDTTKVESLNHVRSAIRFKIDDRFREQGVTMAFAQRDVSLVVKDALNVKVIS